MTIGFLLLWQENFLVYFHLSVQSLKMDERFREKEKLLYLKNANVAYFIFTSV